MRRILALVAVGAVGLAAGCKSKRGPEEAATETAPREAKSGPPEVTKVSTKRLENAGAEPGNWLSHGRTYAEKR